MAYDKFTILKSTGIPLNIENIDTDQIIPARFLKETQRVGFGDNLFRDWRYDNMNKPITDFILNRSDNQNKILVSGRNFGCGSSREHAAWAIYDFGFRVVVSSFFADIFNNNALNNGLLTIKLNEKSLSKVFELIRDNEKIEFNVDLENQAFFTNNGSFNESFSINSFNKTCLINGYDNIDYLNNKKDSILEFEKLNKV